MKDSSTPADKARFHDFEVDLRTSEVRKHGNRIRLQEKSFQILSLLLERAGELVTRDELKRRLWPSDPFIQFEENLNTNLNRLRQSLGDPASQQRLIRTIPRQGYRFVAPVTWIEETDSIIVERPQPVESIVAMEPTSSQPPPPSSTLIFRGRFRAILVSIFILAVALSILAHYRWPGHSAHAESGSPQSTILMIPFENLSGDPNQDYLSDGMTDELITRLGEISPRYLSVIARSTAMQYKGSHKATEEIAREQHADYILEGSFRRQGNQVRITAELFSASSHGSLWTEAYDRSAGDLLAIQRDVGNRIAESVSLQLLPPPARSPTKTK